MMIRRRRRGGAGSVVAALSAPVLEWTSTGSDTTPTFDGTLTDPAVDDVATLEWSDTSDFVVLLGTSANTLDGVEIGLPAISFETGLLDAGTYYFRLRHARDGYLDGVSPTEIVIIGADPGSGTAGDPLLGALTENITATWDGDNTNRLPVFALLFTDIAVGDVIYELRSTDNFATFDYQSVTVTDDAPITFSPTIFSFGGNWAYRNWKVRFVLERASVLTYRSNDEPAYIDITAPVLTLPTGTTTGQTTADVGATCNESLFTLSTVVLAAAASAPSAAQIIAGTDASDVAAVWADATDYTSSGAKTMSATGLVSNTDYKSHSVAVDAAGNVSNVVSSATFTTAGSSRWLMEGGSFWLLEGGTSKWIMEG